MNNPEPYLVGKLILAVDDEPDILEALEELLDLCTVHTATDYEAACNLMDKNRYNAVILDIMGVRGYDLLKLAKKNGIPALMLTAHALSPGNLKKSVELGAGAYVPKEKMTDIASYLAEMIETDQLWEGISCGWFAKLRFFFDREFGPGWKDKDRAFWESFEEKCSPTRRNA